MRHMSGFSGFSFTRSYLCVFLGSTIQKLFKSSILDWSISGQCGIMISN
jgi:hypothetical protein